MKKPELIETYQRDEYSLYGLWRVAIAVCQDCGAVMGVDPSRVQACEQHDSSAIRATMETRDIGCVIGIPEWQRDTAKAAGSNRGFYSAWYADSSDWSDAGERDAGIEIMCHHAIRLCLEHELG